jgi:hypothetical protein
MRSPVEWISAALVRCALFSMARCGVSQRTYRLRQYRQQGENFWGVARLNAHFVQIRQWPTLIHQSLTVSMAKKLAIDTQPVYKISYR